jgi:Cd2+/Zn2+-exporting ATPase
MNDMARLSFKISGFDCAEEVAILKREIGPLVGGAERLSFDVLNAKMTISGTDVEPSRIIAAVAQTGMQAELWQGVAPGTNAKDESRQRRGRAILTAISGVFVLAGFLIEALTGEGWAAAFGAEAGVHAHQITVASLACYSLAILSGLWVVLPKAYIALKRLRPDMNLLMTVAVIGAVFIGEWFEGATVAFLFSLSLALEAWSVGRARHAVATLLNIAPATVRLRDEHGEEREVPADGAAIGTVFSVKPGERIPLDGVVASGSTEVNQAPITGESLPVAKVAGDGVFAGTINGGGAIEVRSTKIAGDTMLARIIRMVGEAQSRRAPAEQWVEKFARIYTPAVMLGALMICLLPPLFIGGQWNEWFYRALVLLVISCPCALVISTPVSVVAALASAAHHGVLIKGGAYLELPAQLQAIALDKTGTLTTGHPHVVEVIPLNDHTSASLLQCAAALEANSEHPLAKAVVAHARELGVMYRPADEFHMLAGKGATGRIDGRAYWIGSHRYLEERRQETPEIHQALERMSAAGRSVIVVGNETHVCGLLAVADQVRAEAREIVARLKASGVNHVVMLTGDNRATAQAIAAETKMDEVLSELLPEDKVVAIESLLARYGTVAMVGDGVNDAPALGRATIGIAMGAFGSDTAIETADIALMSDDLSRLPWLIQHARRALRIIRQNIVFALAVKVAFVLLTLWGMASIWSAIVADMGASLLVIFNGLRLLHARPAAKACQCGSCHDDGSRWQRNTAG